ncbi:MAG: transposase [Enterococcus faecium]
MTRYEENFKQMIVELNQTGRSVRGLAKEYGLSEATIYKWKNLYLPDLVLVSNLRQLFVETRIN